MGDVGVNKYWIISGGTILESDKPIRCKFEGLELEPLNHASAKRLVEEIVSHQGSRFVLVENDNGSAAIWRDHDVEFTLTGRPSIAGSHNGPDTEVLLPSCLEKDGNLCYLDFSLSVPLAGVSSTWILFVVVDSHGIDGVQQRLDDNLRSVFG